MSSFSDFSAGTEMAGDSGASAVAGQWAVMLVGCQGTPGTKPCVPEVPLLQPELISCGQTGGIQWRDRVTSVTHGDCCKVMLLGPDTCTSSLSLIKAEFLSFFFSFPRMNTILPAVIRQVESGWDGSLGG